MKYICGNLCFSQTVSSKFKGCSNQILRVLLYMRHNWSISRAIQANYEWFTVTWRTVGNCPAVQVQVQGTYTGWMQLQRNVKEQDWGKLDRVCFFARCNRAKSSHPDSNQAYFICIKNVLYIYIYILFYYFRENPFKRQHSTWRKLN